VNLHPTDITQLARRDANPWHRAFRIFSREFLPSNEIEVEKRDTK
jgi:hypothetical protein